MPTGRNPGDVLKNNIDGGPMSSLIYQPSGCGEENMIHMTMPVIAATYLDKTNQWEAVGIGRRYEVLRHIKIGVLDKCIYQHRCVRFCLNLLHCMEEVLLEKILCLTKILDEMFQSIT